MASADDTRPSASNDTSVTHEQKVEPPATASNSATSSQGRIVGKLNAFLAEWGVETNGIEPVPMEERKDSRWYQMFFIWFGVNMNILTFSTGTAGPAFFGLGIKPSLVIIAIVDAIFSVIPAISAVFGPKIGTRAMVQARFSWGYWGGIVPSVLNVVSMEGFLVIDCIIGGQILASVSDGRLDDTLGIVIISLISLFVTFCGYRVIHVYETYAWIPPVITLITMLAVGYPDLQANLRAPSPPLTAAGVLSFSTTLASSVLSWCTMSPDYGVYHSPKASSWRIFFYVYLGFFLPSLTCHMIGAAFAAAAPSVPSWNTGFDDASDLGGLIYAVLLRAGGWGKFLTVVNALSVPALTAPTMYTFGTSFMAIPTPGRGNWFARVPRWVYVLISEAILIPVAIVGAKTFYNTLVDVLDIIGYWSAAFAAIVLVEHFLYRRAFTEAAYSTPTRAWASSSLLPSSIPALVAFACAVGVLVLFMSQVWWEGPVAQRGTGDLGIYAMGVVAGGVYAVLRGVERRLRRRTMDGKGGAEIDVDAQGAEESVETEEKA
ncbi:hypothetical protein CONPUDRAFT_132980 [Coniophora puteana RWD-64-598 SS2]|uniref:Purine-cytosine permease n=1 Tax=Coniophora puteana (strain RWD-64-598) TaxID=741705 RepID=R7SF07_CONPW|nr:uncharacterized protein CONPUDRAFT_132980 [Coniophora puteana RWD-64-598 SS2]EIW74322.1 hypothetical protein CONPUDRAFT_132980 [Coniophora puteana RWD-64-598 SS2]